MEARWQQSRGFFALRCNSIPPGTMSDFRGRRVDKYERSAGHDEKRERYEECILDEAKDYLVRLIIT